MKQCREEPCEEEVQWASTPEGWFRKLLEESHVQIQEQMCNRLLDLAKLTKRARHEMLHIEINLLGRFEVQCNALNQM